MLEYRGFPLLEEFLRAGGVVRYSGDIAFLSVRDKREGDCESFIFLGTWAPLAIIRYLHVHSFCTSGGLSPSTCVRIVSCTSRRL